MIIHVDGDNNMSSFSSLADFKKEIALGRYQFDEKWDTLFQVDSPREIDIDGNVKEFVNSISGVWNDLFFM